MVYHLLLGTTMHAHLVSCDHSSGMIFEILGYPLLTATLSRAFGPGEFRVRLSMVRKAVVPC